MPNYVYNFGKDRIKLKIISLQCVCIYVNLKLNSFSDKNKFLNCQIVSPIMRFIYPINRNEINGFIMDTITMTCVGLTKKGSKISRLSIFVVLHTYICDSIFYVKKLQNKISACIISYFQNASSSIKMCNKIISFQGIRPKYNARINKYVKSL